MILPRILALLLGGLVAVAAHAGPELPASAVIGKEVENAVGEELGEIEDLALDLRTGKVRYAVLAYGGVAGVGERYFAVPLSEFTVSMYEEKLVTAIDRARLERAAGFPHERWPGWTRDMARASELLGSPVGVAGSERIVELEDLVVDVGDALIRAGVLDEGVVPFPALRWLDR